MISFIRSYQNNKTQFEKTVLDGDLFDDVKLILDPKTNEISYPITSFNGGFSILIDRYRAYINCAPKMILYNFSKLKISSYKNLTYSSFKTSLDCINNVIDHNESKLCGVHIGFIIPTHIAGKDIIKMNILMHKYNYCNHDLYRDNDIYTKEFDYSNYKIGFYADSKGANQNYLKVVLKLKRSAEFKQFGIKNINDLVLKKNLGDLFKLFIKRFDEIILVDSFDSFESKDYNNLQDFLKYSYWSKLAKTRSRQTQLRHREKFEGLIIKYNLDSQKKILKEQLTKAFTEFISN